MTKKKRSKRTWRWVARDLQGSWVEDFVKCYAGRRKPKFFEETGVYEHHDFALVCSKGFKELFGFTVAHGECVKVEFSAKVVK